MCEAAFLIILQYKKVGEFLVFNLKNFPTLKNEETLIFKYSHRFDSRLYRVEVRSHYRERWKIEKEGFNIQKNGTFDIGHLYSTN